MAEIAQKRPSLVLRHSSTSTSLSSSAQPVKPRTHLVGKKNRSSGQLSKMTRTQSSKNLVKAGTKSHVKFKKSVSQVKLNKLGGDHKESLDWEEDDNPARRAETKTQAVIHRSTTEPALAPAYVGSFMGVPVTEQQLNDNGDDPEREGVSPGTKLLSSYAQVSLHTTPNIQKHNRVQPQTLDRNVSFAANPTVSRTPDMSEDSSDGNGKQTMLSMTKRKRPGSSSKYHHHAYETQSPEQSDREKPAQGGTVVEQAQMQSEVQPADGSGVESPQAMEKAPTKITSPALELQQDVSKQHSKDKAGEEESLGPSEPRHIGKENSSTQRGMEEQYSDSTSDQEEQDHSSDDESSVEEKAKADIRNQETYPAAKGLVTVPAHDIPMSRTQFRLNLEREHVLNFREPRQRPSHWPSFDDGNSEKRPRDMDTITGRVSVPRVCREARRELKTIRQRGHDPLNDAIVVVLTGPKWRKRSVKVRNTAKGASKTNAVQGGKKPPLIARSQSKRATTQSPDFGHDARVAVVDTFKQHCKRLWNKPVQYGIADE